MFDLYTNFDVIFLPNLTDKIHYQIFDSLGRVVQVLVDNDGKSTTGVARTDNEGNPVAGIDQVVAYKHNVKGEVTEMARDNDVNGKYDYREVYTLNANGGWIEKLIDLTNDNQFDRKEVYTKEADDGLVQTNFYNLVDNRDVLTKIEYYKLNENNQRTELKEDTLGDGSTNAITRYDLDEYGRTEKAYFDTDGDGNLDRIESYARDSNGYSITNEVTDGQGKLQTVRTYIRDANGYMLESKVDNDGDSIVDMHYIYTRDVYGNEAAYNRYTLNTVTGKLEWNNSVERVFNTQNQVETAVYKGIGTTSNYTVAYTYDEYERKVSELYTGDRNYRWDYTYNPDETIKERLQYNLDGVFENKQVFVEYYVEHQLSKTVEMYDSNNELTEIAKYIRTGNGNMINTLRDLASNGILGWDNLNFGDRGANASFNASHDLTTWREQQLAELGNTLSLIRMGNGAVSELTLNPEVVAKISNGSLRVQGAADKNDALNLSGFEKATSSDVRGYDLYTASFEGEDLKLYVQANDSISVIG